MHHPNTPGKGGRLKKQQKQKSDWGSFSKITCIKLEDWSILYYSKKVAADVLTRYCNLMRMVCSTAFIILYLLDIVIDQNSGFFFNYRFVLRITPCQIISLSTAWSRGMVSEPVSLWEGCTLLEVLQFFWKVDILLKYREMEMKNN